MQAKSVWIIIIAGCSFIAAVPEADAAADRGWGAGISYDYRDGDYFRNGVAFQLDRRIIRLPAVTVNMRGGATVHVLTRRFIGYSGDFRSVNATLGPYLLVTSIPYINPFAGVAAGIEFYDERYSAGAPAEVPDYENQRALFFGAGGIEFDLLPNAKPFVEFRYYGFEHVGQIPDDPYRISVGVMVRF